jgi:radical SAM superfamily enzyme YgiQ (UPF0313 family)
MARRLFPTVPEFFDDVDGVVLYEGERPLAEYLAALRSSRDPTRTPNLVHRKGNIVVENSITPPLDLCDLEFPTYDDLPMSLYFDRKLTLRLFRGCYWGRCVFCNDTCDSVARLEGFHSSRSQLLTEAYLERMVRHIRECIERFGQRRFNHADATVSRAVMKQFAETVLKHRLDIEWYSFMRFVPISNSVCRTMAESGSRELKIGLESTSDEDLRRLRKGFLMKTVRECLRSFEGTPIQIVAFMMGLPYQTPEAFARSLRGVAQELPRIDDVILQRFVLVRESPLLRDPESFGMRVTADLRRDLRVYALEYEPLGGMCLHQYMQVANSVYKYLMYARRNRDEACDLYRRHYWACEVYPMAGADIQIGMKNGRNLPPHTKDLYAYCGLRTLDVGTRPSTGTNTDMGSVRLVAGKPRVPVSEGHSMAGTTTSRGLKAKGPLDNPQPESRGFVERSRFPDRLDRIDLGITNRCNQECAHCCNRPQRDSQAPELSLEEIERVARECRALGVCSVALYGGEPTVREDHV